MINLVNISIKQLMKKNKMEKLYIFGASKRLITYKNVLPFYCLSSVTDFVVDNDKAKWGQDIQLDDKRYTIISPEQMLANISKDDKITMRKLSFNQTVLQLQMAQIVIFQITYMPVMTVILI